MPGKNGQFGSHHFPPSRIYQTIELTGNRVNDSSGLSNTALVIRKMVLEKDTVHGICIHLCKKVKYQSFITLLDICNSENARIYGWVEDDFWIAPVANRHNEAVKEMKPLPPL